MISKLSLAKNVMAYAGKLGSQIKSSSSIAQHSPSLKTLQKDTFCHQYQTAHQTYQEPFKSNICKIAWLFEWDKSSFGYRRKS